MYVGSVVLNWTFGVLAHTWFSRIRLVTGSRCFSPLESTYVPTTKYLILVREIARYNTLKYQNQNSRIVSNVSTYSQSSENDASI